MSEKKRRRLTRSFKRAGPVHTGELADLENVIILDRYGTVDEALRKVVNQAPTRPSWADAWLRSTRGRRLGDPLDAQASPEERLAVFQQIKASGDLPAWQTGGGDGGRGVGRPRARQPHPEAAAKDERP
jgi:hypothetical protein